MEEETASGIPSGGTRAIIMEEFVGVALSSLGLLTVHQITSREIQETADRNMMKSQTRKPDQRRNGDEALVGRLTVYSRIKD